MHKIKNSLEILAISTLLANPAIAQKPFELVDGDKEHIEYSALIYSGIEQTLHQLGYNNSETIAALATLGVGAIKEGVYDGLLGKGTASGSDMKMNVIGVGVG